ncbi:hypothetical protein CW304_13605 [Bacillus sp. UFRGS-B20]|nr:hypothetical protein CW304_13605 [Bacillus sp. UFRGS-B20]
MPLSNRQKGNAIGEWNKFKKNVRKVQENPFELYKDCCKNIVKVNKTSLNAVSFLTCLANHRMHFPRVRVFVLVFSSRPKLFFAISLIGVTLILRFFLSKRSNKVVSETRMYFSPCTCLSFHFCKTELNDAWLSISSFVISRNSLITC